MTTVLFTADDIGLSEPIIVRTVCRKIRVRQNDLDAATKPYYTCCPTRTDGCIMRGPTEEIVFENNMLYRVGLIVGYVHLKAGDGSVEFSQEES